VLVLIGGLWARESENSCAGFRTAAEIYPFLLVSSWDAVASLDSGVAAAMDFLAYHGQ
jgi:hypothetical protein